MEQKKGVSIKVALGVAVLCIVLVVAVVGVFENEKSSLQSEASSKSLTITSLNAEIISLNTLIANLTGQITSENASITSLQNQLITDTNKSATQHDSIQTLITSEEASEARDEAQVSSLNTQLTNLKNGVSTLIDNYEPSPSNPASNYSGTGQFNIAIPVGQSPLSGATTATVSCPVAQSGNSVQLALELKFTSVTGSVPLSTGESMTFNFAGATSGSQVSATAQGLFGSLIFNFNLDGTITQNTLTFTLKSASNSQVTISTPQQIALS
ncbi:MAG: hypothetical protein ABSG33_10950 [Candidatus Bathyarchaeia archaeon]|jgi:hypothetical protein